MSDALATSFDSLVGGLAAARTELGAALERDEALLATARAIRLSIDEHLRVVPPPVEEIEEALAAVGLSGAVASSADALRDHGALSLVWGVGGDAFGLARREGDELVARSALARGPIRIPLAKLAGAQLPSAKTPTVLLHGLAPSRALDLAAVARAEAARPSAHRAWSRVLATHPLSRLDPVGHAWTLARLEQALDAAATVVKDASLEEERALVAELRLLAPLPDGGSLSAERLEKGALLLAKAAGLRAGWLARLGAG